MIPTIEDILRAVLAGTMTFQMAESYLAEHDRLQREFDGSDVSPDRAQVLLDMVIECDKQDKKWGRQDHPSLDQCLLKRTGGCHPERMAAEYEMPSETRAKFLCQKAAADGELTFAHIVVEELAESVACLNDEKRMREELVQTGSCIVQWIQAIDRRAS